MALSRPRHKKDIKQTVASEAYCEPEPRYGHCAASFEGCSFIVAGCSPDHLSNTESKKEFKNSIECFDQYQESWKTLKATGTPPKGMLLCGHCVSSSGDLYVYGGMDMSRNKSVSHCDGVYKLTSSLKWIQLSAGGPLKMSSCGMVIIKGIIYVIGGYGVPINKYKEEWTNEIHAFDTVKGDWFGPLSFSGAELPCCADFTITKISDDFACMFGGYNGCSIKDIHLIDFKKMVITRVEETEPWPVGRCDHAACCLGFDSEHPHLLITGGLDKNFSTLTDIWLYDIKTKKWKELTFLPNWMLHRAGHSSVAIPLTSTLVEVTLFGGCPRYNRDIPHHDQPRLAMTTIITFEFVRSSDDQSTFNATWKMLDMVSSTPFSGINKSKLGSAERIRVKTERIMKFARDIATATHDRADMQDLRETISALKQQIQFVEERAEVTKRELQLEIEEAGSRLQAVIQEAERDKEEAQQRADTQISHLNDQLCNLSRRLDYAEVRTRDAETQLQQLQSQWIIPRDEIELTGRELGTGAYGTVKVATFRGCRVAAKCYHQILLSERNLRFYNREISMAARLRHPNLVQFIGASIERELILLTEIMTTSLNSVLDRGKLSEGSIVSISLDVTKALNYLHLMQPEPIIHRDISSTNVLLDPLPDDHWKAKISDYGSVNLLQYVTTAYPGNPFYAAPESENSKLQTPKMDIYSVGVLLMEMLSNELPEKRDRERHILKISVEHPNFIELVTQCLSEERDDRPSAQVLITRLSDMVLL